LKRPGIIIVLQCIVFIALIISASFHEIIIAFGYMKENYEPIVSVMLAFIQFLAILLTVLLFYGLWKRKRFARWGSMLFFAAIWFSYNIFVILLGNGPIHIVKFALVNGISLYFLYQLAFGESVKLFFTLGVPRPRAKKRLKNNMIFHDN